MVGDGARGGGTKGVYFRGGFKFSLKKLVFVVVVVFFLGGRGICRPNWKGHFDLQVVLSSPFLLVNLRKSSVNVQILLHHPPVFSPSPAFVSHN